MCWNPSLQSLQPRQYDWGIGHWGQTLINSLYIFLSSRCLSICVAAHVIESWNCSFFVFFFSFFIIGACLTCSPPTKMFLFCVLASSIVETEALIDTGLLWERAYRKHLQIRRVQLQSVFHLLGFHVLSRKKVHLLWQLKKCICMKKEFYFFDCYIFLLSRIS